MNNKSNSMSVLLSYLSSLPSYSAYQIQIFWHIYQLCLCTSPWLKDHQVQSSIVLSRHNLQQKQDGIVEKVVKINSLWKVRSSNMVELDFFHHLWKISSMVFSVFLRSDSFIAPRLQPLRQPLPRGHSLDTSATALFPGIWSLFCRASY